MDCRGVLFHCRGWYAAVVSDQNRRCRDTGAERLQGYWPPLIWSAHWERQGQCSVTSVQMSLGIFVGVPECFPAKILKPPPHALPLYVCIHHRATTSASTTKGDIESKNYLTSFWSLCLKTGLIMCAQPNPRSVRGPRSSQHKLKG